MSASMVDIPKEYWPSTYATARFKAAGEKLSAAIGEKTMREVPKLHLALSLMTVFSEYGASGNSIPGFRGWGLNEGMALASKIIESSNISERTIVLRNIAPIATSIHVE